MTHPSEPTFTPTADVIESYKDGSGSVVVARAGVPMSWARAVLLGLVSDEPPAVLRELSSGDTASIADDRIPVIARDAIYDTAGAVAARAKRVGKGERDAV